MPCAHDMLLSICCLCLSRWAWCTWVAYINPSTT